RRPFILVGGTLAAAMLLMLPNLDAVARYLHVHSLLAVAVAVALTLDLSINLSFNPTRSIIADVTPSGPARTRGFTWMQTISGFFGVAAYLIGAIFNNYALIYCGVALVFAFSVFPVLFIREPRELGADTDRGSTGSGRTEWGQCLRLFAAHAFSWVGIQAMFVYIIAFIQQKLIPPGADVAAQSGQIIAVAFAVLNTVGFVLPVFVLNPLAERIGQVKTHLLCIAMMAAGYFAIAAFAHTPATLYVLMAVCGIGWAAVVSLPFAILSEKVERSRMGLFMGVFNLSVVLPQLFVSLKLGSVIQASPDKAVIFTICGIALAISAVLWGFVADSKPAGPRPLSAGPH
ncbi:MAG: MFS transporter, partial [Candidatus Xenobia bacterium]